MKTRNFRRVLMSSVARGILGFVALISLQGQAQANSICAVDSASTFSCVDDGVIPAATATGTFSPNAVFGSGVSGRLEIASNGSLDVTLNGVINSMNGSNQYLTAAVYLTAADTLTYTHSGTTSGSTTGWLYNAYLRGGQSVTASTGTVLADGYRVTGIYSETMNGNNTLTGGSTTVSGVGSRGLWTDAYNGVNVTNTGDVTATGYLSRGVIARALPSGDCTESTAGLSTTVNVTGNVTADYVGITTLTCGDSTVNVQAGTTVSVTGTEGQAIRNIGFTSTHTNIDGSVLAASSADRALDVREGTSATVISRTGLMSGTFAGSVSVDTITIAAGGTWTSAGASDFGAGNDSVASSGTISAYAVTFANLENFTNNNLLALNGGSFALIGSTAFTNNGTIQVARGNTTITSDSALFNNGTIDMQNGLAGDVLTITNDYVAGATAALMIDVSENVSDMFVVNGQTTGTTALFVDAPEAINTSGILIGTIEPPLEMRSLAGDVSQSGMKFSLGNQVTRLIDLKLEQIGNNLYLAAVPNALAFQPLLVGQVVRDTWYQSAGVYSAHAALLRGDLAATRRRPVGLWGQVYASQDRYGDRVTQSPFGEDVETDNRAHTERAGAQVGIDARLGNNVLAGLTVGYQKAKADHRSLEGGVDTDGYNVGAFAQFGGSTGVYGSLLVKHDWSDATLTNNAFDTSSGDPDFNSFGGELEAGYRWTSDAIRFDLGASMSHVKTSIDSFSAEGINYKFGSIESIRGNLDARAEFGNGKIAPFVNARLIHEFDGDSKLTLASGDEADTVNADGGRTWVRLEAGINGKGGSGPLLSGWAELGDVQGIGVRGGWRF